MAHHHHHHMAQREVSDQPITLTQDDVILVTGGTGLFGKAVEHIVKKEQIKGKWVFLGSKDGDLRDADACKQPFEKYRPTYVIHLAAFVGGLFKNMNFKVSFWLDNVNMNNNILTCCYDFGVKKTISCLSTCVFPDKIEYPITEEKLHEGPPHFSNNAYAYAKRMLDMLGRWYNEKAVNEGKSCLFTSVIPTNLFGPHDNFNVEAGHVLPGLMHKCYKAQQNGTDFVVFGSGKPLRQFLYSHDAARMLLWTMFNYQSEEPIMLCVSEEDEKSIGQVAQTIKDAFNFTGNMVFDTSKADGQYKKTSSNAKFLRLNPTFQYTPFEQAIKETVQWFLENYETARK
uniref:gdp-l-fucose synthetase n=1 Tax=Naegleria fowleri TaxID=5763 RepID=UPI000BA4E5E1|nr:Chain A, gdp-l-fucose synthetase [Naegleria fowleri]6AQY_B Chain B, gdp-l-fucose synthetase [Naegleria fowleri]6AQY_C Chain C, gdp-l-fucose synthetase [Naegleria fowleri]6AQY_D Chain D, gdp-l-fucose synthetase [Naegleria fowleri]6AQY_E Chain E, gdp-l-fucose synthetase [Naegleria fowleri]6AQY_F Chain F, gdp-l-fucose synthetase [Naegleria fowleri]6AQZ_A Chain A, gdp-l-fucose synthetase [Naegleria fowleri]6AQZ_B Chain B, gdp-l-fucose synthetase [Naegleria fowleri]6AQZ_C Chain C, gdp-l-fucos